MARHQDHDRAALLDAVRERLRRSLPKNKTLYDQACKQLDELLGRGERVSVPPGCHPADTDNAWVERSVTHCHDESGRGFGRFDCRAGDEGDGMEWRVLHSHMRLPPGYCAMLKSLVARCNAYW